MHVLVHVSVHIHVHIQPGCWASSGTTRRELQRRATNIMLVSQSLSLSLSLYNFLVPIIMQLVYLTLYRPTSTSESPTLMAKNLIRRHNQLNLPESPSQGSTPAELAEEEVTKLSDQVSHVSNTMYSISSKNSAPLIIWHSLPNYGKGHHAYML